MRLLRRGDGAPTLDLLVVGLGNPGREYADTRHNVGFMVVDELARRHDAGFRSKFSGLVADVRIDGHRVALLEPQTYMNESGRSVAAAARFYKVPPPSLLVVHDEVDLAARPAPDPARRRPRRPQRPALGRPAARDAGFPAAPHRRGPAGAWGPAARRRFRPLAVSSRRSTSKGSSARAADAVEALAADGVGGGPAALQRRP